MCCMCVDCVFSRSNCIVSTQKMDGLVAELLKKNLPQADAEFIAGKLNEQGFPDLASAKSRCSLYIFKK